MDRVENLVILNLANFTLQFLCLLRGPLALGVYAAILFLALAISDLDPVRRRLRLPTGAVFSSFGVACLNACLTYLVVMAMFKDALRPTSYAAAVAWAFFPVEGFLFVAAIGFIAWGRVAASRADDLDD